MPNPPTSSGARKERYGTNLVELAVDLMRLAPTLHHVVLVAANRKLVALVRAFRDSGTKMTLATGHDVPVAIRAASHLVEAVDEHVDFGKCLLSARDNLH